MVRKYIRKTADQIWSEESMRLAIEAVSAGEMGYAFASTCYDVPKTTLVRRVAKYRQLHSTEEAAKKSWGGFHTVFNNEQEAELVDYVKTMEAQLFGITTKDLRGLAYQLAIGNKIPNPFNVATMSAGLDWLEGFLKRHPEITLRKPEATSVARAMGFNQIVVAQFFRLLEKAVDDLKLDSSRIYNCDETAITTVPKTLSRVLAAKGKRQVGSLTSSERGQLVTAELCISADGRYMPPMLVFPRLRLKPELMQNAPPGCWAVCHPSGWMQSELFLQWMEKFIEFSGARKDNPVLLLLDGHATHTKNLNVIDLARDNGVHLLCFPPHCTHRLQPLDVSFMKPLSTFYSDSVRKWLRGNPGRAVTQFQVANLFGEAYLRSASMLTAINGFRKTGIWPLDPNIFSEVDFIPAVTTDIELVPDAKDAGCVSVCTSVNEVRSSDVRYEPDAPGCSGVSSTSITEGHSLDKEHEPETQTPGGNASSDYSTAAEPGIQTDANPFIDVSIEEILPPPKATKKRRCTRRRGKTALLTSSPYVKELREEQTNKRNRASRPPKRLTKVFPQKRSLTDVIPQSQKKKKQVGNDADCLFCSELYSESNEGWIGCTLCGKWAHCSCAGIADDGSDINYICDLCCD